MKPGWKAIHFEVPARDHDLIVQLAKDQELSLSRFLRREVKRLIREASEPTTRDSLKRKS